MEDEYFDQEFNLHGIVYMLEPIIEVNLFDPIGLNTGSSEKHKSTQTDENNFLIGWNNNQAKILKQKKINLDTVKEVRHLLESELLLIVDQCLSGHDSQYGLKLFNDDLLYFYSSFCFSSNTWVHECRGEFIRMSLRPQKLEKWFQNQIG